MTREQLEHAIRAACDVAGDTELLVFGSQAILASYPDAVPQLRMSIEVDVQPKNRPEAVDAIDGVLGELSQFAQTHGFYVHGVSIDSATLPEGWEDRTVHVRASSARGANWGHCVETHDLAASKLFAYRDKDRDFVRVLIREGLVRPELLVERLQQLPIPAARQESLVSWVRITAEELGARGDSSG